MQVITMVKVEMDKTAVVLGCPLIPLVAVVAVVTKTAAAAAVVLQELPVVQGMIKAAAAAEPVVPIM